MDHNLLAAELRARGVGDAAQVARVEAGLRASFADAILALFKVSAGLMGLAFVLTLSVPGMRLRGRQAPPQAAD